MSDQTSIEIEGFSGTPAASAVVDYGWTGRPPVEIHSHQVVRGEPIAHARLAGSTQLPLRGTKPKLRGQGQLK